MTFFSVDRIENGMAAVLSDDERELIFPVSSFDFQLKEGMVLKEEDGVFSPDFEETGRRRGRAASLLKRILDKGNE